LILKYPPSAAFFKYFLVEIIALLFSLGSYGISFELPLLVSDPMLRTGLDLSGETALRAQLVIHLLDHFDLFEYRAIGLELIKHGATRLSGATEEL
jgi:hypothetical protein